MKRFLDKRIVIAEDNWLDNAPGSDILKPLYDPFSPAGRKAQQIDLQDDKAKGETIKRSELIVRTNADNKSEALDLILTFTNAKIKARSKQTPNGKYLVTFYV